jgi:DNA-binding transcriptional ArsR family regulator
MPKCEFSDCKEDAFTRLFDLVWLCREHCLIVLKDLGLKTAGRPKKIRRDKILKWLEDKTFITLSDFERDFNVSRPTAHYYLELLEKNGILEREGSVWKVSQKYNKRKTIILSSL